MAPSSKQREQRTCKARQATLIFNVADIQGNNCKDEDTLLHQVQCHAAPCMPCINSSSFTFGVLRDPSLSLLPGPTLTTAPHIGLSRALSGSIKPPAVTAVCSCTYSRFTCNAQGLLLLHRHAADACVWIIDGNLCRVLPYANMQVLKGSPAEVS